MKRILFAFVFLLTVGVSSTYAQSGGTVGARPSYPREGYPRTESIYLREMTPGSSVIEGVTVVNDSDEEKTILVYATDSSNASSGGFACEQLADTVDEVGKWMTLDATEVTLGAHRERDIDFLIRVPSDASVGEHNGCIVIQEKDQLDPNDKTAGIKLNIRSAIRVAITVPGDIERSLEVVDFKTKVLGENAAESSATEGSDETEKEPMKVFQLLASVKNNGNVSVDTNVYIDVKNKITGSSTEYGGEYTVLRDSQKDFIFNAPKPLLGGFYNVTLTMEYNAEHGDIEGMTSLEAEDLTTYEDTKTVFVPPTTTGIIIICAVALGIWALFPKKK